DVKDILLLDVTPLSLTSKPCGASLSLDAASLDAASLGATSLLFTSPEGASGARGDAPSAPSGFEVVESLLMAAAVEGGGSYFSSTISASTMSPSEPALAPVAD
ncbi:MAG: hypothetical protein EBY79_07045, partial [Actinobacteria bacterium]|nr:hypothetical protein [Actinomycetota bacterium]